MFRTCFGQHHIRSKEAVMDTHESMSNNTRNKAFIVFETTRYVDIWYGFLEYTPRSDSDYIVKRFIMQLTRLVSRHLSCRYAWHKWEGLIRVLRKRTTTRLLVRWPRLSTSLLIGFAKLCKSGILKSLVHCPNVLKAIRKMIEK